MTDALTLKDVSLSLVSNAGKIDILHDISLNVTQGETLGLVGPSGSGKSSLLMLMGGLETATSGSVAALGTDITQMGEDDLARFRRDNMGVVFQSFHLIPTMTALENVALPLELNGDVKALETARYYLERVGLDHRTTHYPRQLSGGEQQRVAVARAFACRPTILFADEPTGNLDTGTGQIINDLLFDLNREEGTTLVLVTHEMNLAARCNRTLQLHAGREASAENASEMVR